MEVPLNGSGLPQKRAVGLDWEPHKGRNQCHQHLPLGFEAQATLSVSGRQARGGPGGHAFSVLAPLLTGALRKPGI